MTHPTTRKDRIRVAKKHPLVRDKDRDGHIKKKLIKNRQIEEELDEELEGVKYIERQLNVSY